MGAKILTQDRDAVLNSDYVVGITIRHYTGKDIYEIVAERGDMRALSFVPLGQYQTEEDCSRVLTEYFSADGDFAFPPKECAEAPEK